MTYFLHGCFQERLLASLMFFCLSFSALSMDEEGGAADGAPTQRSLPRVEGMHLEIPGCAWGMPIEDLINDKVGVEAGVWEGDIKTKAHMTTLMAQRNAGGHSCRQGGYDLLEDILGALSRHATEENTRGAVDAAFNLFFQKNIGAIVPESLQHLEDEAALEALGRRAMDDNDDAAKGTFIDFYKHIYRARTELDSRSLIDSAEMVLTHTVSWDLKYCLIETIDLVEVSERLRFVHLLQKLSKDGMSEDTFMHVVTGLGKVYAGDEAGKVAACENITEYVEALMGDEIGADAIGDIFDILYIESPDNYASFVRGVKSLTTPEMTSDMRVQIIDALDQFVSHGDFERYCAGISCQLAEDMRVRPMTEAEYHARTLQLIQNPSASVDELCDQMQRL